MIEEEVKPVKEPIPIYDGMPENLKNAINYLNHNGIGLDDKIEDVPFEMLNSDDDAFGPSTDEDYDEVDEMEEVGNRLENISEQEVDTSELDGMF